MTGRRSLIASAVLAASFLAVLTFADAAQTGAIVEDDAGVLTTAQRSDVQQQADTLAATGHPVVVLLRTMASSDAGVQQEAAALMTGRDVETKQDSRDGIVVLVDLTPGAGLHGHAAIYVGAALAGGALSHDVIAQVYDDAMSPALAGGDIAGGLSAGLDRLRAAVAGDEASTRSSPWLTRVALGTVTLLLLACLLVTARGAWQRHGRVRAPGSSSRHRPHMPSSVGGALVRGGANRGLNVAVLLELVSAHAVELTADGNRLTLRGATQTMGLARWESALLADLGRAKDGGTMSEQEIDDFLSRRHAEMERALTDELVDRGWMDRRRHPAPWLSAAIVAALTFAVASAAIGVGLGEAVPEAVCAVSLLVASALADSVRRKVSRLTPEGRHLAAGWIRYCRWLIEEVDAGRVPDDAEADAAAMGAVPADRLAASSSDLAASPRWLLATSLQAMRWSAVADGGSGGDLGYAGGYGGDGGGGGAAAGGTGVGGHF